MYFFLFCQNYTYKYRATHQEKKYKRNRKCQKTQRSSLKISYFLNRDMRETVHGFLTEMGTGYDSPRPHNHSPALV